MSTTQPGLDMYALAQQLWPINRSITGNGVRQTLAVLREQLPQLETVEVASQNQAFDWEVPYEWNVREAWISDMSGRRIIDFANHNLHLMGYSCPVNKVLSREDLEAHLFSLPELPEAIPYVTSYYERRWGFCLSERQRQTLPQGPFRVFIDSTLQPGSLTYGELLLPGETEREVLLSTYVCHPSMGNNELSGPVVTTSIARWLMNLPQRRYSYRILFLPETIGSIVYLSRHLQTLKSQVDAGYVLTCIGDERTYSYLESRLGQTLADRAARHTLRHKVGEFKLYSYLERGSDERQYCSPGVDLPVGSIMRSKYGTYPEYHTSLDNLDLITPTGLQGGFNIVREVLELLEANHIYRYTTHCEPQLGRRGLYPTLSCRESRNHQVAEMMNLLAYADGSQDLISIAEHIGSYAGNLIPIAKKLLEEGLIKIVSDTNRCT